MPVHAAIIPAAGRGSRLAPTTHHVPKELLPVGPKPLLLHALEEAFSADIQKVFVVSSPEKPRVDAFVRNLDRLDSPVPADRVYLLHQQTPRGLADALRLGFKQLSGHDPVLSVLPDNLFLPPGPTPSDYLVRNFSGDCDVLHLLHPVSEENLKAYDFHGIPSLKPASPSSRYHIQSYPKKSNTRSPLTEDHSLRLCGRAVVTQVFFDVLDDLEEDLLAEGCELDDVPVLRDMNRRDRELHGIPFDGRVLDAGHERGLGVAWKHWLEA